MKLTPADLDNPRQLFSRVPFGALLGLQRVSSVAGKARLQLPPRAELGNVIGAVHGGAVFTLLDVAMASAAVSRHDFKHTAVTLNVSSSYLAPGHGLLTADGEWLHDSDGVAFCRAQVIDEQGAVVAQAQGSFRYLPLPVPLPGASLKDPRP